MWMPTSLRVWHPCRNLWHTGRVEFMAAEMPEAEEPENLTSRWMRRIDQKLDLLADIARETRTRVGMLKQRYASLSSRMDAIESRIERIEKRLDLIDAPV